MGSHSGTPLSRFEVVQRSGRRLPPGTQESHAVRPSSAANMPALHSWHAVRPVLSPNDPNGHGRGWWSPAVPHTWPTGHTWHTRKPVSSEKYPGPHGKQDPPFATCPSGHGWQNSRAASVTGTELPSQGVHSTSLGFISVPSGQETTAKVYETPMDGKLVARPFRRPPLGNTETVSSLGGGQACSLNKSLTAAPPSSHVPNKASVVLLNLKTSCNLAEVVKSGTFVASSKTTRSSRESGKAWNAKISGPLLSTWKMALPSPENPEAQSPNGSHTSNKTSTSRAPV
mmetsp:Transcript_81438/g.264441  ORF Transcript_81438/g.264441 Transcript_81438/m.264441 type:complete len:285 (-) Transcript_81438:2241-3095(-)